MGAGALARSRNAASRTPHRENFCRAATAVTLMVVIFPFYAWYSILRAGYARVWILPPGNPGGSACVHGGKLEVWIRWFFILYGILFAIPTLILTALSMPTNASGTGLGDQVAVYANMVWSAYLAVTAVLVAVMFKRLK